MSDPLRLRRILLIATLLVPCIATALPDRLPDNLVWITNDEDPTFPCSYSTNRIVCVAATDQTDAKAGFSNFGTTSVDLAAPGIVAKQLSGKRRMV